MAGVISHDDVATETGRSSPGLGPPAHSTGPGATDVACGYSPHLPSVPRSLKPSGLSPPHSPPDTPCPSPTPGLLPRRGHSHACRLLCLCHRQGIYSLQPHSNPGDSSLAVGQHATHTERFLFQRYRN